jgi:hypothetical protein
LAQAREAEVEAAAEEAAAEVEEEEEEVLSVWPTAE